MKISAINSYKPNVLNNKNNRNNTAKTPSFGYGGDELSPIPDDEFKDLTGGNGSGSTKETVKLLIQLPYQLIKEALGIKPKKNPNEEDPEDFFRTITPTIVEDDDIDDVDGADNNNIDISPVDDIDDFIHLVG